MLRVAIISQKMVIVFIHALLHIINMPQQEHAIKWDVLWELIIKNIQNYVIAVILGVQHVQAEIIMNV